MPRHRHELDNIGPLTAPVLPVRGGPTFPAGLGKTILLAQHASGGSLVTGTQATRYSAGTAPACCGPYCGGGVVG